MTQKDYQIYLEDMLKSIDEIERFQTSGLEPRAMQRVIERNLEIIGEASRRLTQEERDAHPEIPWGDIIGARNVIAHGYDEVSEEILHDITENDLPPLKTQLQKILENEETN